MWGIPYVRRVPVSTRPAHPGRATFAAALKAERKRAGLTQEALANRAGMDRSFYVDVERGKHSIGLDRILSLCDALDIHPSQLFPRTPLPWFHPGVTAPIGARITFPDAASTLAPVIQGQGVARHRFVVPDGARMVYLGDDLAWFTGTKTVNLLRVA